MEKTKKKKKAPLTRDEIRNQTGKGRRKRKKRKYTLYYIVFLIIFLATGIVLSMTVFFSITTFDVENPGIYSADNIAALSGIPTGSNLICCNTKEAEDIILESCIYLDDVNISRKFPSTLKIECVPAVDTYSIQQEDGNYTYISAAERVLEVGMPAPAEGSMTLVGMAVNQAFVQGEFLDLGDSDFPAELEELQVSIASSGLTDITSIQFIGDNGAMVEYQGRIHIQIDDLAQAQYLLTAAQKIISEYIGTSEHGTLFYDTASQSIHFLPDAAL